MGIHDLWLFVLASLLLCVTPGPDMALIIARASRYGVRGGVAVTLGVALGSLLHSAAAAAGISALIMASAAAFAIVKWAGALYLAYLGVQMLLARRPAEATTSESPGSTKPPGPALSFRQIFLQGAMSNILNPKVAIFFLAFLPQFVDTSAPSAFHAILLLGLILNAIGTAWNLAVAWFAARIGESSAAVGAKLWLERSMGAFFLAIGVRLALIERP